MVADEEAAVDPVFWASSATAFSSANTPSLAGSRGRGYLPSLQKLNRLGGAGIPRPAPGRPGEQWERRRATDEGDRASELSMPAIPCAQPCHATSPNGLGWRRVGSAGDAAQPLTMWWYWLRMVCIL